MDPDNKFSEACGRLRGTKMGTLMRGKDRPDCVVCRAKIWLANNNGIVDGIDWDYDLNSTLQIYIDNEWIETHGLALCSTEHEADMAAAYLDLEKYQ
jgi:hypothetical protein